MGLSPVPPVAPPCYTSWSCKFDPPRACAVEGGSAHGRTTAIARSRRLLVALAALVLPLVFLATPAAAASNVSVAGGVLTITADGADDRITVVGSGETVTVQNTTGLTLGAGCTAISSSTTRAFCVGSPDPIASITVNAGAGNDRVSILSSKPTTIDGGGGDDALTTDDSADTVNAGDGNDTVNGGAGNDALDGGPGIDTLTFSSRSTSVTIDLAAGTVGGANGEADTATNFENAIGGRADDTITGSTAANRLFGGRGWTPSPAATGTTRSKGATGATRSSVPPARTPSATRPRATVTVTLGDGLANDGPTGENDNIDSTVENVTGGFDHDTLTGSAGPNTLTGGGGTTRSTASGVRTT